MSFRCVLLMSKLNLFLFFNLQLDILGGGRVLEKRLLRGQEVGLEVNLFITNFTGQACCIIVFNWIFYRDPLVI